MSRLPRRLLLPAWLALVAAPGALVAPPAAAGDAGWRWPLAPRPAVVARFDAPAGPYAPGHRGADLAARVGQPVVAPGAGVVAFAGPVAGRPVVSLVHPDGRRTTYEPVAAGLPVGTVVAAGQRVGSVAAAAGHCLPRTCLHWGLRAGGTYLDPLTLLGAAPVRLLPVWAPVGATGWWGPVLRLESRAAPGPVTPARPDRGPLLAGLQQ